MTVWGRSLVCFEINVSLMASGIFSSLGERELPITSVLRKLGVGIELDSFPSLLQLVCGAAAVTLSVSGVAS